MSHPITAIPEKLYFKIGEVCEIVGVQAHVLRYWETEFPMLQPQKNRAGQRTYRRRDVEMALRVKELLYDEQYTIAGAKKRLAHDTRGAGKLKVVGSETAAAAAPSPDPQQRSTERATLPARERGREFPASAPVKDAKPASLKQIAEELRGLLALLDKTDSDLKSPRR